MTRRTAMIVLPPSQVSCAQPNWVQRVGIAAQAWVARLTGLNIGVGVGGSAGAGIGAGVGYGASRQMVVSPSGQAAIVTTFSSAGGPYNFFGPVLGIGVLGGLQLSIGSATTSPDQLAQPALDVAVGGGYGYGGGADLSLPASGGWQLNLTGGGALGGYGGAGSIVNATATPVCH